MSKAASNEKRVFKKIMKYGITFSGKYISHNDYGVRTSVDEQIEFNDYKVLLEIDSYNMAKVVLGQYVLLNSFLKDEPKDKIIFIIVHCYKGYNTDRTIKHLDFVCREILSSDYIKYLVYNEQEFYDICSQVENNEQLINKLFEL